MCIDKLTLSLTSITTADSYLHAIADSSCWHNTWPAEQASMVVYALLANIKSNSGQILLQASEKVVETNQCEPAVRTDSLSRNTLEDTSFIHSQTT